MGRITILDEVTAGRIAAGEVVERPASVVKELVENSLDAGASRIDIELEDGGRALIKVSDNGTGMDSDDVLLAFQRHATSKLTCPEDLDTIGSYGFRGEALPSVGAVARVRLLSARVEVEAGSEVVYEGGRLVRHGPGAARTGTVIWVRDLFFNTPARRQAMRSAPAETARVSETAGTLALARPDVAVSLAHDGKSLWATPGTGRLEETAASLFGVDFARNTVPVDWQSGGIPVRGLAGLPGQARRDGKRQYLFCNGRPITPKLLRSAVEEAYRGLLESGRTPVFILELATDPQMVDVNIHPAKTFVRFRHHGDIHRAVLSALRTALSRSDLFAGRLGRVLLGEGPGESAAALDGTEAGAGLDLAPSAGLDPTAGPAPGGAVPGDWRELFGRSLWPEPVGEGRMLWPAPVGEPADHHGESARPLPNLEALGQVAGLFLVARGPDGLYVVDQHAAHERILFDRLVEGPQGAPGGPAREGDKLAGPGAAAREPRPGPTPVQVLAVPETLDLGPGEEEILDRSLASLRAMGFDLEPFGGRTVVIRAMPAVLAGVPAATLVAEFLDRLECDREPGFDRARAIRAMAACRAALKAGAAMTREEMQALLDDLGRSAQPRTCPHGRPTILRLGVDELRRAFSRQPAGRGQ